MVNYGDVRNDGSGVVLLDRGSGIQSVLAVVEKKKRFNSLRPDFQWCDAAVHDEGAWLLLEEESSETEATLYGVV